MNRDGFLAPLRSTRVTGAVLYSPGLSELWNQRKNNPNHFGVSSHVTNESAERNARNIFGSRFRGPVAKSRDAGWSGSISVYESRFALRAATEL